MISVPIVPVIEVNAGLVLIRFPVSLDAFASTAIGARSLAWELWRAANDAERQIRELAAEQRQQLEEDLRRVGY